MRIYTSANDPLDFCSKCFPLSEDKARELYANLGDGPDGRGNCFGYAEEHPDYDGENYHCCSCGKRLTALDSFVIRPDPERKGNYIVSQDSFVIGGSFLSIQNARDYIRAEILR